MGNQQPAGGNRRAQQRQHAQTEPMKTGQTSWSRVAVNAAAVLARWLLGAVFLYMGLSKALHPVDFLKLLRQYDLVQSSLLLNSMAATLPWFEVFCGLLLLAGIAVRGTALALMFMLVPFTLLVLHRALLLHAALAIPFCAVEFDCGCGAGVEFICRKLSENLLLFMLSVALLAGRGRQFSLRFRLMKPPAS
jgi:uncharacterized membrane protein YphA (DoxX/SURF4 family)